MTVISVILNVLLQAGTIIAFLAVVGTIVYLLTEKTNAGRRLLTWMETMGLPKEISEDEYTNFVIHPSNYIKVPSNH